MPESISELHLLAPTGTSRGDIVRVPVIVSDDNARIDLDLTYSFGLADRFGAGRRPADRTAGAELADTTAFHRARIWTNTNALCITMPYRSIDSSIR